VADDAEQVPTAFAVGDLIDADPAQPVKPSPRRARASVTTRSIIRPTVAQSTRISRLTTVLGASRTSHTWVSSKARVKSIAHARKRHRLGDDPAAWTVEPTHLEPHQTGRPPEIEMAPAAQRAVVTARSIMAAATISSPKISSQAEKGLLLVTIRLARS